MPLRYAREGHACSWRGAAGDVGCSLGGLRFLSIRLHEGREGGRERNRMIQWVSTMERENSLSNWCRKREDGWGFFLYDSARR